MPQRIVTETWIWDSKKMRELHKFIEQIEDFTRSRNVYQPKDTHLVLELVEDAVGHFWCAYYYVCHSTRNVFWLEKHDISEFVSEVRGELYPTHISMYRLSCHSSGCPELEF